MLANVPAAPSVIHYKLKAPIKVDGRMLTTVTIRRATDEDFIEMEAEAKATLLAGDQRAVEDMLHATMMTLLTCVPIDVIDRLKRRDYRAISELIERHYNEGRV